MILFAIQGSMAVRLMAGVQFFARIFYLLPFLTFGASSTGRDGARVSSCWSFTLLWYLESRKYGSLPPCTQYVFIVHRHTGCYLVMVSVTSMCQCQYGT